MKRGLWENKKKITVIYTKSVHESVLVQILP